MNATTKAKLLALHDAALVFLAKPTKVWVAVVAGVVGLIVGAIL